MKTLKILTVVLGLASGAGAFADDAAVARIDGSELTSADVQALLQTLSPPDRAKITADRQLLKALIRSELGRRAVLEAAHQAKWEQKPEIQALLSRVRDEALMNSFIESAAALPAGYPSDAEAKQAYEANISKFMLPRQYHLAQIFLAAKEPSQADALKAKAEELAKKAKANGADFAQLAKANSDEKVSAANGGDLGWVNETQLVPEIVAQVRGMTDREVGAPVQTSDGWHIVQLLGTKPPGPQPFEEAKATIVASMRQQRAIRDAQAYVQKLLSDRHAELNEIALDKFVTSEKPAAAR